MWGGVVLTLLIVGVEAAHARTYHVAQNDRRASDANAGTLDAPLKSLGAAVKRVTPGDEVIIYEGVYREAVIRGNLRGGPESQTVFRAAPGDRVVISGADPIVGWTFFRGKIWVAPWTQRFGEIPAPNNWPPETWRFPMNRREEVFVDGYPMIQVASLDAMSPGSFYVDEAASRLLVWLLDGSDPAGHSVEVSMRSPVWRIQGCSFIRIEGLVFRHAAGPVTQEAVSFPDCDAVEVVGNRIEWNAGSGLGIAHAKDDRVLRNVVNFNGGVGIVGYVVQGAVFEDNETSYNNWRSALAGVFGWHFAGVKLGVPTASVFQRHVAVNNLARGIWLDFNHSGNTIDRSLLHGNMDRGVYLEAGVGANWLLNSVVSGTRGIGHGVNVANSPDQRIYHNTFVGNGSWGIWAGGSPGPRGTLPNNSLTTNLDVRGNLFHDGGAQGAILLQQLTYGNLQDYVVSTFRADGNVYYNSRREDVFQVGRLRATFRQWQERGWDAAGRWGGFSLVGPQDFDFRPSDPAAVQVNLGPEWKPPLIDLVGLPRNGQSLAGALVPSGDPLPPWANLRFYAPLDEMPLVVGNTGLPLRVWQVWRVRDAAPGVRFAPIGAWGASDVWLAVGQENDHHLAVVLNPAPWPVRVSLRIPNVRAVTDRATKEVRALNNGRLNLALQDYGMAILELPGPVAIQSTARVPAWVTAQLRKYLDTSRSSPARTPEALEALALADTALRENRHVAAWEALASFADDAFAELGRTLRAGRP